MYLSVYFALEISEVARGLGKWARCSCPLMGKSEKERKYGAASSEGDPDSGPATTHQRQSLFPEEPCKGQGPFQGHITLCEHLGQTVRAGVCPCTWTQVLSRQPWVALRLPHGSIWPAAPKAAAPQMPPGRIINARLAAKMSPSRGLEGTRREPSGPCTFSTINYCK